MRFLSYRTPEGRAHVAVTDGTDVFPIPHGRGPGTLVELASEPLPELRSLVAQAMSAPSAGRFADMHLLPVIDRPGKMVCLGLNYADHALEGGFSIPDYPALFLRVTSSLVGHGQPILRPLNSEALDYEAEPVSYTHLTLPTIYSV